MAGPMPKFRSEDVPPPYTSSSQLFPPSPPRSTTSLTTASSAQSTPPPLLAKSPAAVASAASAAAVALRQRSESPKRSSGFESDVEDDADSAAGPPPPRRRQESRREPSFWSRLLTSAAEDDTDQSDDDDDLGQLRPLTGTPATTPVAGGAAKEDRRSPTEKPQSSFWTRVLFGDSDSAESGGEGSTVDTVDAGESQEQARVAPCGDTPNEAHPPAPLFVDLEDLDDMDDDQAPHPHQEQQADGEEAQSQAKPNFISLSGFRSVAGVLKTLPGISFLGKLPGASYVAKLPVVAQALSILSDDAQTPQKVAVDTDRVLSASVLRTTPGSNLLSLLEVPAPPGSFVAKQRFEARKGDAGEPATPPPSPHSTASLWASWVTKQALTASSRSLNVVNSVGDVVAGVAARLTGSPTILHDARDFAVSTTGSIAVKVIRYGSETATKLARSSPFLSPSLLAGEPHSPKTKAAKLSSLKHVLVLASKVVNPLSFSFGVSSLNGWIGDGDARIGPASGSADMAFSAGAASCLLETFRPEFLASARFLGCGLCSVVAAAMALDMGHDGLADIEKLLLSLDSSSKTRFLGPIASLSLVLQRFLESFLPQNISKAQGRLFISVTLFPSFENEILCDFESKESIIDAILASSFVPVSIKFVDPPTLIFTLAAA
ncbi:hypothetical protein DFJ73DRAFT_809506 [Zopfochytrium polystomum]|nr:hypothetical protein DFJ73DRAFT_809506 [Zopfochytrium polystomum]